MHRVVAHLLEFFLLNGGKEEWLDWMWECISWKACTVMGYVL